MNKLYSNQSPFNWTFSEGVKEAKLELDHKFRSLQLPFNVQFSKKCHIVSDQVWEICREINWRMKRNVLRTLIFWMLFEFSLISFFVVMMYFMYVGICVGNMTLQDLGGHYNVIRLTSDDIWWQMMTVSWIVSTDSWILVSGWFARHDTWTQYWSLNGKTRLAVHRDKYTWIRAR